jgi:DNA-binding response OmpR family regulator
MASTDQQPSRPSWLFVGGPALRPELQGLLPDVDLRLVGDGELAHELAGSRPRIVIVAQPPADAGSVEMVVLARKRPRSPIRTVLLTTPDDVLGRMSALDGGFDDALPASIDARELATRLRRLGASVRPVSSRSTILIADGVELDLQACELRRDGRPQRLRPKEFQLLALLAAHPRRAYTRPELIERVWVAAFAGDPRTIDVHLRWLRSKVEADPERPAHLVTVRGHGYRFDPPEQD